MFNLTFNFNEQDNLLIKKNISKKLLTMHLFLGIKYINLRKDQIQYLCKNGIGGFDENSNWHKKSFLKLRTNLSYLSHRELTALKEASSVTIFTHHMTNKSVVKIIAGIKDKKITNGIILGVMPNDKKLKICLNSTVISFSITLMGIISLFCVIPLVPRLCDTFATDSSSCDKFFHKNSISCAQFGMVGGVLLCIISGGLYLVYGLCRYGEKGMHEIKVL